MSPTPVREAFRVLETEGYVESKPHRGVVVAERDYADVIDAYEVRVALETLAIRRLATTAVDGVVDELRVIVDTAARAMRAGDTNGFRRASITFHERITAAAGSGLLKQIVDRLGAYWFFFPQDPSRMAIAHREHVSMLESLARGDAEGAITVLRRHMEESTKVLRSVNAAGAPRRAPPRRRTPAPENGLRGRGRP